MLRKVNAYCIESEALHFAYLFSIASDFDFVSQLAAMLIPPTKKEIH